MDIGGIIGGIAKSFGGGGGLDIGRIVGDIGKVVGGGGAAGGANPLGNIISQGVKLLGGGGATGGDPISSIIKMFTGGGGDAAAGAGILGGVLGGGNPIEQLTKSTDLAGVGRMLNPNLPADQAAGLENASAGVRLLGNGGIGSMLRKGDPAMAGQLPGKPDMALARANADKALSQIDWSKDTIGLWVPGTGGHNVDPKFAQGLGPNTSTVAVDYQSNLDMPTGVATAMETTRLILEETAKRGKKVNLGGHSQGAWVAGEVMANPGMRDKVNKAVLYGHPTQGNAQYDDGKDPKVREINNADDPYTQPEVDLLQIGAFLLGQGNPSVARKHAYDFTSEAAWLNA